jgi:hypothetical protein
MKRLRSLFLCSKFYKMNHFQQNCLFSDYLLPFIISGPSIKWYYYSFHLISSCIGHVVIADCKKLKSTSFRWPLMG